MTAERLAERRREVAGSPDLQALLARLVARAGPVVERLPHVPQHKALLSTDGGVCPADGGLLSFDPWSPHEHRCPRCGAVLTGERHDRHWARFQHLWLAERAAHLAAIAALADHDAAAARAREILAAYAASYFRYPNRDNVLGPSRLFFSTYLESVWVLNYLAAATLLRAAGRVDDATSRGVSQVADEAATLIGEFDEGFSNRQTWSNAALAAIAVWFEDEELARRALEGRTGLIAHLAGFRRDGMWYEGENYHLFALRGLLVGACWAREAGVDFFEERDLRDRLTAALLAPAVTALPDLTFPARKDARFGVSLAQPMYVETWEVGLGMMGKGDGEGRMGEIAGWLNTLYRAPAPPPEQFESYLHDARVSPNDPSPIPHPPSRASLSWWALLQMPPELPTDAPAWQPGNALLAGQGLAILRGPARYVSLECGPLGGGHGHPDRLHLTLHADGVHWLADPGTGSYVSRDLSWYRSPLAHNAPILDAGVGAWGDAVCEMFEAQGEWAWVRGRAGEVSRTVVAGPRYVLDLVESYGREERTLDLPWHVAGRADVVTRGRWQPAELASPFVTEVERFVPAGEGPLVLEATSGGRALRTVLRFDGELLRASAPGRPGVKERGTFVVARVCGRTLRLVTVLEPVGDRPAVADVRLAGDIVEVETGAGVERHRIGSSGWAIEAPPADIRLAGEQPVEPPFEPLLELDAPTPVTGTAFHVADVPPLDGTAEGFDTSEPLRLELEDQYRRSEEPYPGAEDFSALAHAAWDEGALYLAIEVTKADLCFRPADAPPLGLDNEPDDIHSDGVQVYLTGDAGRGRGDGCIGYLVIPAGEARLRVRPVPDAPGDPSNVRGAWQPTDAGYRVTLAIPWPEGVRPHVGGRVAFDLIVNEMLPGRERRAGQLVWSGGNGWVWLRGDRQAPGRFGVLELVG